MHTWVRYDISWMLGSLTMLQHLCLRGLYLDLHSQAGRGSYLDLHSQAGSSHNQQASLSVFQHVQVLLSSMLVARAPQCYEATRDRLPIAFPSLPTS